jgi:hypothetical protein
MLPNSVPSAVNEKFLLEHVGSGLSTSDNYGTLSLPLRHVGGKRVFDSAAQIGCTKTPRATATLTCELAISILLHSTMTVVLASQKVRDAPANSDTYSH